MGVLWGFIVIVLVWWLYAYIHIKKYCSYDFTNAKAEAHVESVTQEKKYFESDFGRKKENIFYCVVTFDDGTWYKEDCTKKLFETTNWIGTHIYSKSYVCYDPETESKIVQNAIEKHNEYVQRHTKKSKRK